MSANENKNKPSETTNDRVASEAENKANSGAVAPGAAAEAPPVAGNLEDELRRLKLEKEELWNQLVRRQADFENFRKRVERDLTEARQLAAASVIEELLPVVDALDRALVVPVEGSAEEFRKGFDLIRKQFVETLARFGLKAIEAVGKPFDPHYHHAVERIETAGQPDHTVVAEVQRGYTFRHKVLRPALVRVAVHPRVEPESQISEEKKTAAAESEKPKSRLDIN